MPKEVVPDLFPHYKDTFQHTISRAERGPADSQSEASIATALTNERPGYLVTDPAVLLA